MFGFDKARSPEPSPDVVIGESEYDVVKLRLSWGLLSIAVAAFSLPLRFWARWLPWHPRQYFFQPGVMLLGILSLAAVGCFFGWLGMRQDHGRGLAKIGLFLNITVASVLVLFAGAMLFYVYVLR